MEMSFWQFIFEIPDRRRVGAIGREAGSDCEPWLDSRRGDLLQLPSAGASDETKLGPALIGPDT